MQAPTIAERIMANNAAMPVRQAGFAGFFEGMAQLFDPRSYKRRAAETLAYVPLNRAACIAQGRNHLQADAELLARAAHCRREAQRLTGRK
jgi:hypothetical protein